jgi:hypothetical protein
MRSAWRRAAVFNCAVDVRRRAVRVLIEAELPEPARARIARAEAAGIRVTVAPAAFPRSVVDAVLQRIVDVMLELGVSMVGASWDGTQVLASFRDPDLLDLARSAHPPERFAPLQSRPGEPRVVIHPLLDDTVEW